MNIGQVDFNVNVKSLLEFRYFINRSKQNIDIILGLDLAQLTSHGDDLDATFTSPFL